jgi:hypothetical protein
LLASHDILRVAKAGADPQPAFRNRKDKLINRSDTPSRQPGLIRRFIQQSGMTLARVPTSWNHLVEKNSRKINCLSMILAQKWFPLLRIML